MPELAVEARNLSKRFGDVVALDGIDLEVPAGTVLGLLGPNGAGKTTAVRILTTVLEPDGGEARVLGVDVTADPNAVRASIGLAGQYAAVDGNLTGRENLRLIGKLTHLPTNEIAARADELLETFDLTDAGDRTVRTYSGGMRRRLDLAAALVHRPPMLILDEPTAGLDPQSRIGLWEVIERLVSGGTTVLLTTQYLEEADRLADRIVVIDHGQVIAEGTAVELKARLGGTVVEIGFGEPGAAVRAAAALARFAVRPPECDERLVHVEVHDGAHAMVEMMRALDVEGLDPSTLSVRDPSLDDVFLTLTGKRTDIEDDDAASKARKAR